MKPWRINGCWIGFYGSDKPVEISGDHETLDGALGEALDMAKGLPGMMIVKFGPRYSTTITGTPQGLKHEHTILGEE